MAGVQWVFAKYGHGPAVLALEARTPRKASSGSGPRRSFVSNPAPLTSEAFIQILERVQLAHQDTELRPRQLTKWSVEAIYGKVFGEFAFDDDEDKKEPPGGLLRSRPRSFAWSGQGGAMGLALYLVAKKLQLPEAFVVERVLFAHGAWRYPDSVKSGLRELFNSATGIEGEEDPLAPPTLMPAHTFFTLCVMARTLR